MKIRYYLLSDEKLQELTETLAEIVQTNDFGMMYTFITNIPTFHSLASVAFELADYRRLYGPIGLKLEPLK